jgi:hypothetical protein
MSTPLPTTMTSTSWCSTARRRAASAVETISASGSTADRNVSAAAGSGLTIKSMRGLS